jgi:hypothetical protein
VFRVFNLKGFTMSKTATKTAAKSSDDLMSEFAEMCEQPAIKALLASTINRKADERAEVIAAAKLEKLLSEQPARKSSKPAGMVALPPGVSAKGKAYNSKVGVRVQDEKWQHLLPVEVVRFILSDTAGAERVCKECDRINEA